jgi:hypothetical protein
MSQALCTSHLIKTRRRVRVSMQVNKLSMRLQAVKTKLESDTIRTVSCYQALRQAALIALVLDDDFQDE